MNSSDVDGDLSWSIDISTLISSGGGCGGATRHENGRQLLLVLLLMLLLGVRLEQIDVEPEHEEVVVEPLLHAAQILGAQVVHGLVELIEQVNGVGDGLRARAVVIERVELVVETSLELADNRLAVVVDVAKCGDVLVVVEQLARLAVVVDGASVGAGAHELGELGGQVEQELELLEQAVDAAETRQLGALVAECVIDALVEDGNVLHVDDEALHLLLHGLEVAAHAAYRVRGTDELVVILRDERLHLAVQLARLLHDLRLDVHDFGKGFLL